MKYFLLTAIVFTIDQLSKHIIVRTFHLGESLHVLPFFHITYVSNTGTAFGLFQGINSVFIIISAGVIGALILWRKAIIACGSWAAAGYILVLGGAFGNLVDRITHGEVIDFLDFLVWPVFNLADTSICIGTVLLALFCSKKKKEIQHA